MASKRFLHPCVTVFRSKKGRWYATYWVVGTRHWRVVRLLRLGLRTKSERRAWAIQKSESLMRDHVARWQARLESEEKKPKQLILPRVRLK